MQRGLLGLDTGQLATHGGAHVNGVGIALFFDEQADALTAVVSAHGAGIGHAVHHLGHILHAHHPAGRGHGHHHFFHVLHRMQLAGELHGELAIVGAHRAGGHLAPGPQDGLAHLGQAHAVLQQTFLVHLHLHLALFAAQQGDLGNTLELLDARQQLVREVLVEFRCGHVAERAQAHDG